MRGEGLWPPSITNGLIWSVHIKLFITLFRSSGLRKGGKWKGGWAAGCGGLVSERVGMHMEQNKQTVGWGVSRNDAQLVLHKSLLLVCYAS